MPIYSNPIDLNLMQKRLELNFETGDLIWKPKDVITRHDKKFNTQYAGTVAGCVSKSDGYLHVVIDRVAYRAHRIVFMLDKHRDIVENMVIDHINMDKLDNRPVNLRERTNQQNLWNTKAAGCTFHKAKNKWMAQIAVNGKNIYLGYYATKDEAHNAYLEAKAIHHILV